MLIFLLFLSCGDERTYINKMLNKSQKLAKEKYNLTPFGSGIAGPNKIQHYSLDLITKTVYSENDARFLLINFVEDFISLANEDLKVISDIENPPFNELHGSITIGFIDSNGDFRKNFAAIESSEKEIIFYMNDQIKGLVPYRKETYEDAYFKVKGTYPPPRN